MIVPFTFRVTVAFDSGVAVRHAVVNLRHIPSQLAASYETTVYPTYSKLLKKKFTKG